MISYGADALRSFFEAVDAHLEEPLTLIVVGGGALVLGYGLEYATYDIDFYECDLELFKRAVEATWASTSPCRLPYDLVTVGDAPYNYEDRLEVALKLSHLTLCVPERHDLAVMKALRANEHDLQALEALHQHHPLSLETFLDRLDETKHAIGEPGQLRARVLLTVERLFGSDAAESAEIRLKAWPTA
jgi:hypothetical protein